MIVQSANVCMPIPLFLVKCCRKAGAVTLTHYLGDVVNVLDTVREATLGDGCVINFRNVVGGDDERGFSATTAVVAKLQVRMREYPCYHNVASDDHTAPAVDL